MASGDEEEKSFGQKLLSTFLRGAGRLPQVGIRPSGIPGVPTTGYGAPRTSGTAAGPLNPVQKRAQATRDAREAPDPVPLPGPVQSADPSEYRGIAATNPKLFESGLVTVHGKRTDAGNALVQNAQARGKDIDQMVDFYSRGLVGSDLFLTEKGKLFAEIDQTNSIDSILQENDRTEGFRLYKEAEASGAMDLWEDRMGMGAETGLEFLGESWKQLKPDAANLWEIVKGFPESAATFWDRLARDSPVSGGLTVSPAAAILAKLTRGDLSEEEEAELAIMKDEYLREGLFRMSATYSNGFVAALTHNEATRGFFTDEDRLRSKYHYRKDLYDIDRMEAGEATAELAGFQHSIKQTLEDDVAFFDGKATAQEEFAEIEEKKAKAGATVEGAVNYLRELDLAENIDLSLPPDQRQQSRVERVKELALPVATILSPDVIASVGLGFGISGAFKMSARLPGLRRKEVRLKAEGRRIDADLQAGRALQKKGTPSAQAQLAPGRMRAPSTADLAKLQTQKAKIAGELTKLQKRIGRIDGTVPGVIGGFLGATTRAVRGAPLRVGGAALTATGNILQRIIGPGTAGVVGAVAGVPGGFVGSGIGAVAGTILGLGARGKVLSRFGEKMSRVGQELTQRRMAYPMHRKFAQEAKTNKLKQYHLLREGVYGVTVGLTSKFARLWRDVFIAELPFSYVAAGGFSQAGGNFLSQAAVESLLIEGPIVGAGKVIGRAAGMQMSGNIKDHNRLAHNAALNFRDQFLTDPDQRAAFDALPPVVKRMYGNAFTNNPDLKIEFITDLEQGAGLYDPDTNTIVVNPNDPRGVETILAHEFRHQMDMQGFSQTIIDSAVGPRGFLRQKPAEDSTTGVGELIPEFQEWAESLNEIRIKGGKKPFNLNTPEGLGQAVLEWSAYSSMDSIASGLRNNVLIEWSRRHPWTRSFYDSLMGRFFRQDSLMNAGMLFDQNGNLATQPGIPGMDALKAHPAISARLERMTQERAGIGFTADERADFDDPNSKRKKPSPTAIRQGDKKALKEVERDMHMDLKTDQAGTVVEVNGVAEVKPEPPPRELLPSLPDKDFEAPKVNEGRGTDNATDLTGALTAPADPKADVIPGEPTELVRRDANVEALKQHFREGYGYNDLQLGMIDDLIDIMSDPNRRGEAVLGYYFPVWKKERKKARKGNWMQFVPKKGIDAKWYRFVPYGLVQTDVGNVLVKAISMDQVILNAQIIAKSQRGREVYGGDVGKLMDDFNEMVRNHGRNIQNAARFNPDKLALLNAVFGDVGRGHKQTNLLLQNDPQIKKVRSAVRSYRIERFSQMNSGIKAGFPFSLEKTKAMEMPAQDPQVRQRDEAYQSAVEQGDTETAQRMFDKETQRAGFKKLYHSTEDESFTRFEVPAYFSDNKVFAGAFGSKTREVLVRFNNPERIDGETSGRHFEWDAEDVARFRKGGRDSVHITHPDGDVITVFDSNQIKSADPVTRDDQGNVIPLSKRFDTGEDIRGEAGPAEGSRALEMPAQDPQVSTPEFRNFFGESKVTESNGAPLVVYHGSKSSEVTEFDPKAHSYPDSLDSIGTWFTSAKTQAPRYAPDATVYPVYLRIENPWVIKADPALQERLLELPVMKEQIREQMQLSEKLKDRAQEKMDRSDDGFLTLQEEQEFGRQAQEIRDEIARLSKALPKAEVAAKSAEPLMVLFAEWKRVHGGEKFGDPAKFVEHLRSRGHDGIALKDTRADRELGGDDVADWYIAFDSNQIKSATQNRGTFDRDNPNIMEMPAEDPQVQQGLPLPETIDGTPTTTPEPTGKFALAEAIGDPDRNFAARENMRGGTGVAKNKRIRLEIDGKPLTLGADPKGVDQGKAHQDWTDETEGWLSPEEIQEFSRWYEEIEGFFVEEFGKDAEKWMLAWLASQQNESPTGGIRNSARVLDSLMGMKVINPKTGRQQRGGLAHDKLVAIFQGTSPEKGFGPKLADFLDAGLRRKTRTYHGDRPEAGMPFVADVHTGRDSGHIDQQTLTRLKESADKGRLTRNGNPVKATITKTKTVIVKDSKGRKKEKIEPQELKVTYRGGSRTLKVDMQGSPSGGQYEGISKWGNGLTEMLNYQNWQGRNDWTPASIQAIGWMRTLRQHGRPEETLQTSIDRNTYRISQEVDYDLGGLGPEGLPVFGSLSGEVKTRVTQEVLEPFVAEVVKEVAPGAVLRGVAFGKGYWEGSAAPSAQFWVMGSEEAAANVELAMAWIGEQAGTARVVLGKGGKNSQAVVIRNADDSGLTDTQIESLTQFIMQERDSSDKTRAKDAQVLVGYSNHILPGDGGVISFGLTEAKMEAAKRALNRWLETLVEDLVIENMSAQASFSSNDWKNDPDGQGYLQDIEQRGSVEKIREKLARLRGRYWTSVRQALRQHGGAESGIAPGQPSAEGRGVEFQQGEMPGLSPPTGGQKGQQ
jgi:hypothetical protein